MAQWTRLTPSYPSNYRITDVAVSDTSIFGVGYRFTDFQGYVFRSFNNGIAWDSVEPLPAGFLYETIAFKDADTAIVGGLGSISIFLRSVDRGHNWIYYMLDTVTTGVAGVQFLNSSIGFAGGYDTSQFFSGNCYYTNDGGNSWITQTNTPHTCLDSLGLDEIDFVDVQTGYAVSNFGLNKYLLKTTDTGKHWDLIYTQEGIGGVYFWNVMNGVMVAEGGQVFKTSDGGMHWVSKPSPVTAPLFSVSFIDDHTGYAVGAFGTIIKSVDGGESWTRETSSTSQTLLKVKYFNNRPYACGDGGTILRLNTGLSVSAMPIAYKLNVYPNPASSVVSISSTTNQHFDMLDVKLVDVTGKILRSSYTTNSLLQFDVSNLASSTYTVVVVADGHEYNQKVTISH